MLCSGPKSTRRDRENARKGGKYIKRCKKQGTERKEKVRGNKLGETKTQTRQNKKGSRKKTVDYIITPQRDKKGKEREREREIR